MIIVAKSPARTIKVAGNRVAVLGVGRGPAGTPLYSHQLLDVESSSRADLAKKVLVVRTPSKAIFDLLTPSDVGAAASTHQHSGSDITSGTVSVARLGSGVPGATNYLRGDGSWQNIAAAELPSGINVVKLADGTVDNTEFQALNGVTSSIQTQLNGKAASVHQHSGSDITSGTVAVARLGSGTPTASTLLDGSGAWRALAAGDLPAHSASLITSGTLATSILASGGSSANFFRGDGTFTNVLTSGITVGAAINLGNTATVTAANNQIYGGAGGPAVNAPTGSTFQMQTNGTTRANISLNGLIFPASATAMAAANISIGSGAASTMHLNVPTGGLFLFCEAATSGVVISSASKYLQFQAAGGVLGAAGNAAHTYLAGGNSAANFAGAWLRAYGNSSVSSPGQMILAPGNVAGAKISILDTAGTERLAVTAEEVTCAAPLVTPTATPASASATGVAGQWAWDTNYIYICTATNTWRRVAHATW